MSLLLQLSQCEHLVRDEACDAGELQLLSGAVGAHSASCCSSRSRNYIQAPGGLDTARLTYSGQPSPVLKLDLLLQVRFADTPEEKQRKAARKQHFAGDPAWRAGVHIPALCAGISAACNSLDYVCSPQQGQRLCQEGPLIYRDLQPAT